MVAPPAWSTQLMLEGAIHALVDAPVEHAAIMRAVNDAARISSTADALERDELRRRAEQRR